MKRFKHLNATSLETVAAALAGGKAKAVAGGTDLIGELKDAILPEPPEVIVNLKTVPGLDFIRDAGDKVIIGSLTRVEDIATSAVVRKKLPMLAEAASVTASPHIREMGTIGGNICQANRCWYYWVPDNRFNCMRKGGDKCYALTGEGRYHSIFGGVKVGETPCSSGCPDSVEISDYMAKLRVGDTAGAAEVLLRRHPLPAVTGRVCPHFCESRCSRNDIDAAVSIRAVERALGDYALAHAADYYAAPAKETGKHVAVVGAGPSGLTAACYLRKAGHAVTVHDAMEQPGGLLRYGIPAYRLPRDVVDVQVKVLADMGITFRQNTRLGTDVSLDSLTNGYDAVYMACGAWQERPAGFEGEDLLLSGFSFLREVNRGNTAVPGTEVAVIGGGNVAIDVARTLLRLGCKPEIIYRRTRAEMSALAEEITKAEEENIPVRFLTLPVKAVKRNGRIVLTCRRMELGPADESGRPRPVPVTGSEHDIEYDAVITAIGEKADTSLLPAAFLDEKGWLPVDKTGCQCGENIFVGGDFVTGPATVVEAIAAGHRAAVAIERYFGTAEAPDGTSGCTGESVIFTPEGLQKSPRHDVPELPVEQRIRDLTTEEAGGLSSEEIAAEVARCMDCSCVAVNPSDLAPALIALDATIVTTKRELAVEALFTVGVDASTVLAADEIVTEIRVPSAVPGARGTFNKFALRKSIDFPVANCAAVIGIDNGIVTSARICLNSVHNNPLRLTAAEDVIVGKTVDETLAEEAAGAGLAGAVPLPTSAYKVYVAKSLVKKAILACAGPER